MPGHFLGGNAWLDTDGKHVWFAHDCAVGRTVTMLPWPRWWSNGTAVAPSVACEACGFHAFVPLGAPEPPASDTGGPASWPAPIVVG